MPRKPQSDSTMSLTAPPPPLPGRIDAQALLSAAVSGNASVEMLERLMVLAKDTEAWNARRAYNAAIAEFQQRCPVIKKLSKGAIETRAGGTFSWQYAALDDAAPEIKPILGELGLSYSWNHVKPSKPDMVALKCRVMHKDGHWEEADYPIEIPYRLDGRLSGAHAVSSATTMAERLSLFAKLGIVPEGADNDGSDTDEAGARVVASDRLNEDERRERASADAEAAGVAPPGIKYPEDRETADLLAKLIAVWRKNLTVAQVVKILAAKGLSETLVRANADWSKVDPAVVRDLAKEAGLVKEGVE